MRLTLDLQSLRYVRCRAFTLIELLAVIVIIGILAGLGVGVGGLVSRRAKESRVKAELLKLETAIRSYKARFGFYPPDNLRDRRLLAVNPVINQLYYELNGAVYDRASDTYLPVGSAAVDRVGRIGYMALFGAGNFQGVYNSSENAANVQNFLGASPAGWIRTLELSGSPLPRFSILAVPVDWPANHPLAASDPRFAPAFDDPAAPASVRLQLKQVNPWRYNSSNPTNNPGEFDLWAEIVIGDDIVTIGNWAEE